MATPPHRSRQRLGSCEHASADPRNSLLRYDDRGVRGRVDACEQIAHPLEILGYRRQFSGVVVAQCGGESGRQANTRPFDNRFEFLQAGRRRTVAELRRGLQQHHLGCETSVGRGCFGRRQRNTDRLTDGARAAATHARARLLS